MDIKDFKENIGQQAERIIAQGLNLQKVGTKYRCNNTYAHKNGDRSPSMAWDRNALQFFCFACSHKIDIYEYYTKYQGKTHGEVMEMYGATKEEYKIEIKEAFKAELKDLTVQQVEYLKKRGLSDETIRFFKLGDYQGNIGIPYFDNGTMTGVKYKTRSGETPKYKAITGSQFGMLNKDNLNIEEPLVISEGELDCMSVYEAGYKNVVSVGTGGSSLDKLFRQEGDFLRKFNALIIFADADEVGKTMRKKFLEQFGYLVKFPDVETYKGCKDANEILLQHGKEQILKVIKSASIKIEGLVNINDDIELDISKLDGNYIPTGMPNIDLAINDLSPQSVSLITGRSNSGKSTYVTQIIVNALDKGFKVFLMAGEGITSILVNNIYRNCIGAHSRYYDLKQVNKRYYKIPKPFVVKALKKWHGDRLSIFSRGESKLKSTDELLELMAQEIKLNKPDLVIIDNLMSILSVEKASEKYEKQADFVQYLSDLAKAENTHISLVLHPNKEVRKGGTLEMENISGSSDIYNKADVILAVKRIYDEDEDHDGEISVIKNRYYPDLVTTHTIYDHETGMLLELGQDGMPIRYNLQWEKYLDIDEIANLPEPVFQVDYEKAYTAKYYKPKKKEAIKPEEVELKQVN